MCVCLQLKVKLWASEVKKKDSSFPPPLSLVFASLPARLNFPLFTGGVEKAGWRGRIKAVRQAAPIWEPVQRATVAAVKRERVQDLQYLHLTWKHLRLPAYTVHHALLHTAYGT